MSGLETDSKPDSNDNCDLKLKKIVNFEYSFGYDCQKLFNIVCLDEEHIAFTSGCYIHFVNIHTSDNTFLRTRLNNTIGHMTVNNQKQHLAVGENGSKPTIFIYQWPEMNVIKQLKCGAQKTFCFLNYSPSGELLASQSGESDYLLTIWNWSDERVVIRAQAHVNDVYKIIFSPYQTGLMSTCGRSHIKFWKMIDTFTGLKLKGEIGRFGNRDICDIIAAEILPDQTVLSGDDKGNLFVWEGGLIQNLLGGLKKEQSLHKDIIVDIIYEEHDDKKLLITIGQDGQILFWNYNQILELCLLTDTEDLTLSKFEHEIKCFEYPSIKIASIVPYNEHQWFLQDAKGAIWCLDIEHIKPEPVQLYKGHAGVINDLITCPILNRYYFITIGDDGQLIVYNYAENLILFYYQFLAKSAEKILWIPIENVNGFIIGFSDGSIRLCILKVDPYMLDIIQIFKTHSKSVTALEMDYQNNILVSAAEDKTVFFYRFSSKSKTLIEPIGFLKLKEIVTCLYWLKVNDDIIKILIGCTNGYVGVINAEISETLQKTDEFGLTTYEMVDYEVQYGQFVSCKSRLRHEKDLDDEKLQKENDKQKRLCDLKELKEQNPEFNFDEDEFLEKDVASVTDDDTHWVPYIPKTTGKVLFIVLDKDREMFWVSMSGYDCGYKYEFHLETLQMIDKHFECFERAEDEQIFVMTSVSNDDCVFYGMESGAIRITSKNGHYYQINMHCAPITKLVTSIDGKYLFSAGKDGNIFSYKLNLSNSRYYTNEKSCNTNVIETFDKQSQNLDDMDMSNELTVEELLQKRRLDNQQRLVDDYKSNTLEYIKKLQKRFQIRVKEPNSMLPKSLQLDLSSLSNEKVTKLFENWKEELIDLTKSQIEYDLEKARVKYQKLFEEFIQSQDHQWPTEVKGIKTSTRVATIKCRALTKDIRQFQETIEQLLMDEETEWLQKQWKFARRKSSARQSFLGPRFRSTIAESFMYNLPTTVFKTEPKLKRLLTKYRERKKYAEIRQGQWDEFNKCKPIAKPINEPYHPDDVGEINRAIQTIGDFQFKTTFETCSKVANEKFVTVLYKSKELIDKWLELNRMCNVFNQRIFDLIERRNKLRPNEIQKPETGFLIGHINHRKELNPKKSEIENSFKDDINTDWHQEKLQFDQLKNEFEMKKILEFEKEQTETFDKDIEQLEADKKKLMVDMTLMKLHTLSLNQELEIVKKYEPNEKTLIDKIEENEFESKEIKKEIFSDEQEIQVKKIELEQLKESQTHIYQEFESLILDNKFAQFLRKIFHKKIPTDKNEMTEHEILKCAELSTESTEESETYFDETICPPECDPNIYQLIFPLRDQRYEIEFRIDDENESITRLKESIQKKSIDLKSIEDTLKKDEKDLFELQTHKLEELNSVENVAILRLSQISGDISNNLDDAILFSNKKYQQLSERVNELKVETSELNNTIKSYKMEISKVDMECKQWQTELKFSRNQLDKEISSKFRDTIKSVEEVNEMDEFIIRRLVHRMRLEQLETEIRKKYKPEIDKLKLELQRKKDEYLETIHKNTCRNELLTWLQREISKKPLKTPNGNEEKQNVGKQYIDYDKLKGELEYLEGVSKWQKTEIDNLCKTHNDVIK